MAYRSTKEKAAAQAKARKLYVAYGMSLDEIHEETGETIKTLRSWSNLGDWKGIREEALKSELDRLVRLRNHLLDKAEAQIKEDKLPHTEIGLVYKLERLIFQREKKEERDTAILVNTLQYLVLYLMEHDPKLAQALGSHLEEFSRWIVEQDITRRPEEFARPPQEPIHFPQEFTHVRQKPIRARKNLARARKSLPRMRENLTRIRKNLARARKNPTRPTE